MSETRVPTFDLSGRFKRRCQVCGDSVEPLKMWQEVLPDGLVRGHELCCKRVALVPGPAVTPDRSAE